MSAADNRALIKRFYDEGWNANNLDVYDELVTDDFVDHQAIPGLPPGREGFKGLNVMFRSADDLATLMPRLLRHGLEVCTCVDVLRFLGARRLAERGRHRTGDALRSRSRHAV